MSFAYAVPVLLLTVLYRIIRSTQRGSWDSHGSNSAVVALCIATSVNAFRRQVDLLTGVPNLASLISHVVLVLACVSGLTYLDYLIEGHSSSRLRRERFWAALIVGAEVGLWLVARPLHGTDSIPDLVYVRDPVVVSYSAIFYAYLLRISLRFGFGCLAQVTRRSWRRLASIGVIGVGVLTEAPVIVSWLLATLWGPEAVPRSLVHTLHTVGGLGLITLGLGMLSLAVPGSWWRMGGAVLLLCQVLPLWRWSRQSHPMVALDLHTRNPVFLAQRAVIEIQDGLALARFRLPADASLADLARALRRGDEGSESATALVAAEQNDWGAVLRLGRSYWCAALRERMALIAGPITRLQRQRSQ